mgnify:CR=1 FL=1
MSKKKLFNIDKNDLMFNNKVLFALLIPIVIEQLLNSFMGMVDTMMVSNLGSQAISGVSLVDSVNNLIVQLFSAMATGAAIICSHYIGMKDKKGANKAARQVVLTVAVIAIVITIIGLLFRRPILSFIFGKVEQDVMDNAVTYFLYTALSYPFLALFSAGSAIFRSCGNSRYPMVVSIISNLINVTGNAILMFGLNMGVAGAAISTLVSRIFCMVVIFIALSKPKLEIVVSQYYTIRPDFKLIASILAIGVPSGIENSMFQFGKLAIQSTVSTMGTAAIAAQAMTNILENVNRVGEYLGKRLDEIAAGSKVAKEARGMGLMRGLECDAPVGEICAKALDKGLLLLTAGTNVIRFVPPLVIKEEHVDQMAEILTEVLKEFE